MKSLKGLEEGSLFYKSTFFFCFVLLSRKKFGLIKVVKGYLESKRV